MLSANHFCNLGISVSGSKQILIRGLATVNPAAAAAAAEEAVTAASRSTTDEDVDGTGGLGGGGSNDGGGGGAKANGLSRCWNSNDAVALALGAQFN